MECIGSSPRRSDGPHADVLREVREAVTKEQLLCRLVVDQERRRRAGLVEGDKPDHTSQPGKVLAELACGVKFGVGRGCSDRALLLLSKAITPEYRKVASRKWTWSRPDPPPSLRPSRRRGGGEGRAT